jgi:hypothetical protein
MENNSSGAEEGKPEGAFGPIIVNKVAKSAEPGPSQVCFVAAVHAFWNRTGSVSTAEHRLVSLVVCTLGHSPYKQGTEAAQSILHDTVWRRGKSEQGRPPPLASRIGARVCHL